MGLEIGSSAPSFALTNKNGDMAALTDLRAKHAVIYFYNKDDTSLVKKAGNAMHSDGFFLTCRVRNFSHIHRPGQKLMVPHVPYEI